MHTYTALSAQLFNSVEQLCGTLRSYLYICAEPYGRLDSERAECLLPNDNTGWFGAGFGSGTRGRSRDTRTSDASTDAKRHICQRKPTSGYIGSPTAVGRMAA